MDHHAPDTTRVAIVLDIDDNNPDLLFVWAGIRAVKLVQELSSHGLNADVVSIDIDGDTHNSW
jgi:hypothetical protein